MLIYSFIYLFSLFLKIKITGALSSKHSAVVRNSGIHLLTSVCVEEIIVCVCAGQAASNVFALSDSDELVP